MPQSAEKPLPGQKAHTRTAQPDVPRAEEDISDILRTILSIHLADQEIGLDDDFYAMGGDSLTALRVVSDAQSRGLPLTLRDLLHHPTARELATALASATCPDPENGAAGAEPETTGRRATTAEPAADGLLTSSDRATLPSGVADALPASALQVGIIYLCESSGDRELYHSLTGWEVLAPFDEGRFRSALGRLCDRHGMLRTSFDLGSYSTATQLVWSEPPLPLSVDRLPDPDPQRAEALLTAWRTGLGVPFDWSRAPLFRCHVVAQPDGFHVGFAAHHAIIDGWSLGRVIVELLTLYAAALEGSPPALPPLPTTGARDFVAAERQLIASPAAARFWHAQADAPALLFQRGQFSGAANACARDRFALSPDQVATLRAAARDIGVPLKTLAFAAHVRALAAWTRRDHDVVTGLVVNTRTETPGSDLLVGLYLNTVPVRVASPTGTWADLAHAALTTEREASPYRGYPLAEIENRLGRPAFDVVFNFMNFHVYEQLEDLTSLPTRGWWVHGKPSYPFRVDVEIDGPRHGSGVVVDYDPGLLSGSEIDGYTRLFEQALARVAADPRSEARLDSSAVVRRASVA